MDDSKLIEYNLMKELLEEKDREITHLKRRIEKYEEFISTANEKHDSLNDVIPIVNCAGDNSGLLKRVLSNAEVARYSRQLILPEIGIAGQLALKKASVLIVGAGGLGCPAGIYLAAAGVGKIGVVDYDEVEVSNLHRQILHKERCLGLSKALSFAMAINCVNSSVKCVPHVILLNSTNAKDIICQYDIVIDATDNVATRYLLNDACVLYNKPLVSGSALRLEGQLTVYNYKDCPCYRCLFPVPPDPETTTSCSEGGVLGVIPGVIGCLQAFEAIKLAVGLEPSYCKRMLLLDGKDGSFLTVNLRSKKPLCAVCGVNPSIKQLIDYEQFCGANATDKIQSAVLLTEKERVSCKEYKEITVKRIPHLLIDVRSSIEMNICSLPNSLNVPFPQFQKEEELEKLKNTICNFTKENNSCQVFLVCRRGNDSQKAVRVLQKKLSDTQVEVKDIKGGLHAWSREIDSNFPVY